MDVKPGSESSNEQSRRRTDRTATRLVRNLDWGISANDIALHPQSALSIVDALDSVGTSITLLPVPDIVLDNDQDSDLISTEPSSSAERSIPPGSNITPIINRADNRDRTMSVNLLTLQVAMDLREKCKRLAVESALVRNRREKQLYLTVGMLSWQHERTSYESPLLFFPVTLISEASRNGVGYVHQLYNSEGIPDFNYHLREFFHQCTGVTLPEYLPQQSIEAFLKRITERVATLTDLKVDGTMRLGISSAPAGLNPDLPESHQQLVKLPAHFLPSLAQDLIADHDMEDLQLTLNLLDASNDYQLAQIDQSGNESLNATTDLTTLRTLATQLSSIGIGHVEFQYLSELPERINDWIAGVEPILDSELVNRMLRQRDIKAVQLMKLAGIIELLDKAPAEIDAILHRDLAYAATPMLFKRARHQARLIEDELSDLQQHFHLDRLPAKAQLLQLIEELGGPHTAGIEVIDSDYFNARRQFMNFSTDKPTTLSEDHKRLLNKLVKVLRFRELFVNNTEYRLALGPAYRGLKTDWTSLEAALNYAQELSSVLGTESIAANALNNWPQFRHGYSRALSQLQSASVGLRGMLQIIRSTDQTTTANELLIKSRCLVEEMGTIPMEPVLLGMYADKDAQTLLRLLSAHRSVDDRTQNMVQDANSTIRDFLSHHSDGTGRKQLKDTLDWLRDALSSTDVSLEDIREAVDQASQSH